MALVKITNGSETAVVTRSAFETMYKKNGWKIGAVKKGKKVKDVPVNSLPSETDSEDSDEEEDEEENEDDSDSDSDDEEDDDEELSETPLSEMNFEQLQAYADELKVEHKGMRSKDEIREAISKRLNE